MSGRVVCGDTNEHGPDTNEHGPNTNEHGLGRPLAGLLAGLLRMQPISKLFVPNSTLLIY